MWAALGAAAGQAVGNIWSYNRQKRDSQTASSTAYKRQRVLRQTAYQDTVGDLEKAGLNRILAAGGQPTPATSVQQSGTPEKKSNVDFMQNYLMKTQATSAKANAKASESMAAKAIQELKESKQRERSQRLNNEIQEMDVQHYKNNPMLRKTKLFFDALAGSGTAMTGAMAGAAAGRFNAAKKHTQKKKSPYRYKSPNMQRFNRGLP